MWRGKRLECRTGGRRYLGRESLRGGEGSVTKRCMCPAPSHPASFLGPRSLPRPRPVLILVFLLFNVHIFLLLYIIFPVNVLLRSSSTFVLIHTFFVLLINGAAVLVLVLAMISRPSRSSFCPFLSNTCPAVFGLSCQPGEWSIRAK